MGCSVQVIKDVVSDNSAELPKNLQSLATHATDFDLWLACYTQEEIAEAVGITKQAASLVCQEMADLPKLDKSAQSLATHATDFDMWLACYTQEEIAEAVGCDKAQVNRICCETADLPKCNKSAQSLATHATDFEPQR